MEGVLPVGGESGCDCAECVAHNRILYGDPREITPEAIKRGEVLLRRFCTPRQVAQWEAEQRLTVRGSDRQGYLLTPRYSPDHRSVIRSNGLGISVWPMGLRIAADWALALKLYLEADAQRVLSNGCHDSGFKSTFQAYAVEA